jgi:hypothetical protein
MGRICRTHGRDEKCIPEGMRPLGGRRWKDNIKMELEQTRREGMDWIELAQKTVQWRDLLSTVMKLRVP